jgi:hypothetical protein
VREWESGMPGEGDSGRRGRSRDSGNVGKQRSNGVASRRGYGWNLVVVALDGTSFLNGDGEEVTVQRTSVGGVASDGILCDSRMLVWSGGGSGVAAQVPDSFEIGSAPPSSKP